MNIFNQRMNEIFEKYKEKDPNMSIETFSRKINLPYYMVRAYLRDSVPHYDNRHKIAENLGVSYEYLYGYPDTGETKEHKKKRFYENIYAIMKERDMSLNQITGLCGISYPSFVTMMYRNYMPSYTYIRNIANKLNVAIEDLMEEDYSLDDDIKENLSRLSTGNKKFICKMVENMVNGKSTK